MAAGAATGALAALQRWAGLFRLPLEVPEPRFLAAGLIGNAGDVGMALVVPALLLFTRAAEPRAERRGEKPRRARSRGDAPRSRRDRVRRAGARVRRGRRGLRGARLPPALSRALAPSSRRRFSRPRPEPDVAFLLKLDEFRRGDLASATTQRDIGLLAGREMIRARPLLGVGPGAFSNRFVPARLAAEERTRRHLVHRSGSAHFDNAHSEPVTLAAETGVPAALAAMAAACRAVRGTSRPPKARAKGRPAASRPTPSSPLFSPSRSSLSPTFRSGSPSPPGPPPFSRAWRSGDIEGDEETPDLPVRGGRAFFATLALLLVALAAVRSLATFAQAEGETLLRDAAAAPEDAASEKAELLSAANARLARTVALRPRSATALLAWGSVQSLRGERELAYALYCAFGPARGARRRRSESRPRGGGSRPRAGGAGALRALRLDPAAAPGRTAARRARRGRRRRRLGGGGSRARRRGSARTAALRTRRQVTRASAPEPARGRSRTGARRAPSPLPRGRRRCSPRASCRNRS